MTTINVWMMDAQREVLLELGRVTLRWASLDQLLVEILDAVLENREAAYQCILGRANAGQQRFRAFERVIGASKIDQPLREALIGHMKTVSKLYNERNEIVHRPLDTQITHLEGTKLKMQVVSIGRNGKRKVLKIEDLQHHCATLDGLMHEIEDIGMHLNAKWASEQPTSSLQE